MIAVLVGLVVSLWAGYLVGRFVERTRRRPHDTWSRWDRP